MSISDDQNHTIVPDPGVPDDIDSGIGEDAASLTQSIRESLLESVTENGRGYHRYQSTAGGEYPLPEDEGEQDRLDLQHEMFMRTFKGKLYHSPIGKDVKEVLDLGTGTGIWAIDFADEHPEATVTGTDLSPIQPIYVPPNLRFEVDDFNSEWTFNQQFDFIHARALVGSSKDFPAIIRQAYESLKPGGWLEMSDVQMPFLDDDGSMKGTLLEEWSTRHVEACAKVGIDTTAASQYKGWFINQGFEEVTQLKFKWPVGSWPRDAQYKFLGKMTRSNFVGGIEGFTLRLWTGVLGMSYEEVMLYLVGVKRDIINPRIHSYWPVYTVFGRKPTTAS